MLNGLNGTRGSVTKFSGRYCDQVTTKCHQELVKLRRIRGCPSHGRSPTTVCAVTELRREPYLMRSIPRRNSRNGAGPSPASVPGRSIQYFQFGVFVVGIWLPPAIKYHIHRRDFAKDLPPRSSPSQCLPLGLPEAPPINAKLWIYIRESVVRREKYQGSGQVGAG